MLSKRLWFFFAVFVLYATSIPFDFDVNTSNAAGRFDRISLNPFISPQTQEPVSITDSVQNVLLFVPFGALGVAALAGMRGFGFAKLLLITVSGALLSATVETVQLFLPSRIASVADLATNTTGTVLGAVAVLLVWPTTARTLRRLAAAGAIDRRTFYPMMVALGVVCIAAWEPFDVALDVGGSGRKVRDLILEPLRFSILKDEGIAILHYGLLTAAVCSWLDARRAPRPEVTGVWIVAIVALTLEGSQVVIDSRVPNLQDAAFRVAAVVLGAWGWTAWRRSHESQAWLIGLGVLTGLAAVMDGWSPFEIAAERRAVGWVPLVGYYRNNWFPAVSEAVEMMLLYLPLGFCLALYTGRAVGITLVLAVLTASPIEYFQGWFVERVPGVTDVGLAVLGGWLGAKLGGDGAQAFQAWIQQPRARVLARSS